MLIMFVVAIITLWTVVSTYPTGSVVMLNSDRRSTTCRELHFGDLYRFNFQCDVWDTGQLYNTYSTERICGTKEMSFYIDGCREAEDICNSRFSGLFQSLPDGSTNQGIVGILELEDVLENCGCIERTYTANGEIFLHIVGVGEMVCATYPPEGEEGDPIDLAHFFQEEVLIRVQNLMLLNCSVDILSPLQQVRVAIIERRDAWDEILVFLLLLSPKGELYDDLEWSVKHLDFRLGGSAEFVDPSELQHLTTEQFELEYGEYNTKLLKYWLVPPDCLGFEEEQLNIILQAYVPSLDESLEFILDSKLMMPDLCTDENFLFLEGQVECWKYGTEPVSPGERKKVSYYVEGELDLKSVNIKNLILSSASGVEILRLVDDGEVTVYGYLMEYLVEETTIDGKRGEEVFSYLICGEECPLLWESLANDNSHRAQESNGVYEMLMRVEVEVEYTAIRRMINYVTGMLTRRSLSTNSFMNCLEDATSTPLDGTTNIGCDDENCDDDDDDVDGDDDDDDKVDDKKDVNSGTIIASSIGVSVLFLVPCCLCCAIVCCAPILLFLGLVGILLLTIVFGEEAVRPLILSVVEKGGDVVGRIL